MSHDGGMVVIGVIAGLIAAFMQSISYILSRHVLHAHNTTPLHLMLISNVWMGLICVVVLPFVWPQPEAGYGVFFGFLAFQILAYLGAQAGFFWAIRHAAASRVSPMMGIKIVFSAILAFSVRDESLNLMQIAAVVLTLVAAFAVSKSGERIPWKALLGTLIAVICFALSDLGITLCADAINSDPSQRTVMVPLTICIMSYSISGILALALYPVFKRTLAHTKKEWAWKASLGYSLAWLAAMVFLFTTFAMIGLVFGAIAQSLRGPLSVLLAALIAKMGWEHIEQKRSRADFIKQVLSALLMVVAISLYCLS